jgi:hypothetical protein
MFSFFNLFSYLIKFFIVYVLDLHKYVASVGPRIGLNYGLWYCVVFWLCPILKLDFVTNLGVYAENAVT